jgi:hypothetical protein
MATRDYPEHQADELHSARWELLEQINRLTERPMIASFFVGQDRGEGEQSLPAEEIAALRAEVAALGEELRGGERLDCS